MARFTYPYASVSQRPNALYPKGRTAYRPLLSVKLLVEDGRFYEAVALADSGADACLFPLRLAKLLGLDLTQLPTALTSGVGNSANLTYYSTIEIDLGNDLRFETQVGFTEGMDNAGFGLLGQQGFFENYNVEFLHKQRQFSIEPA